MSPLFTVLLGRIFLKERQTLLVYLSLVPIVGGVALATVTELRFDLVGLLAALISCLMFTMQNLYSKKLMRERRFDHMNLLYQTARLSTLMMLPVWAFMEGPTWYSLLYANDLSVRIGVDELPSLLMRLVADGFCNHGQVCLGRRDSC